MLKKHKLALFCLFLLILILGANFALAADRWRAPEIQYPSLPFSDIETPQEFIEKIRTGEYSPEQALPLYVKYLYHLFLTISGLIAFGAIVYGGFNYLIAGVSPERTTIAREQITGGILGLIILLSSYLILTTINPQLVIFSMPGLEPPSPPTESPIAGELEKRTYFQIPTGKIIERAVIERNTTDPITGIAKTKLEEARDAAQDLKAKSEELKTLIDGGWEWRFDLCMGPPEPCPVQVQVLGLKDLAAACRCGRTEDCGEPPDNCPATGCDGGCDDAAIAAKISQITTKIEEIKIARQRVKFAQWDLESSLSELSNAGALMSAGCLDLPIPYNEMVNIREIAESEIETLPAWENIQIEIEGKEVNDPATFYCSQPVLAFAQERIPSPSPPAHLPPACPATSPWSSPPSTPTPIPSPPSPTPPSEWQWPVDRGGEKVTQEFGPKRCCDKDSTFPCYSRCPASGLNANVCLHNGIDIGDSGKTLIMAAADGVVEIINKGWGGGYGKYIGIRHGGGIRTLYAHLWGPAEGLQEGQTISKGTVIGYMDDTGYSGGSHLHFTIFINGSWYGKCDTANPRYYLP
ncbi:MAG: M23 family metallopeptidase [Nanoarchaeota archaeon]|nr:M23 family metallopeptidase [Nanoarchaeota archaeon]